MRDEELTDATATVAPAGAVAPFVMVGDDAALCVDGVCAVPVVADEVRSGVAASR